MTSRQFHDLNLVIEHPRGTVRTGTNAQGQSWAKTMFHDYGYIRRSRGHDDEHIDVYVGNNKHADNAYVIHQHDPVTQEYDEDKVMLGFTSPQSAKMAYLMHAHSPQCLGSMTTVPFREFQDHVKTLGRSDKLTWKHKAHMKEVTEPPASFTNESIDTAVAEFDNLFAMNEHAERISKRLLDQEQWKHLSPLARVHAATKMIIGLKEANQQGKLDDKQLASLGGIDARKTLDQLHTWLDHRKDKEEAIENRPAQVSPEERAENERKSLVEQAESRRSKTLRQLSGEVRDMEKQGEKITDPKAREEFAKDLAKKTAELRDKFNKIVMPTPGEKPKEHSTQSEIDMVESLLDSTKKSKSSALPLTKAQEAKRAVFRRTLQQRLNRLYNQRKRENEAQAVKNAQRVEEIRSKGTPALRPDNAVNRRFLPAPANTIKQDRFRMDIQFIRTKAMYDRIANNPGGNKEQHDAMLKQIAGNVKKLLGQYAVHVADTLHKPVNSPEVYRRVAPYARRAVKILGKHGLVFDLNEAAKASKREAPEPLTVAKAKDPSFERQHPRAPRGASESRGGEFIKKKLDPSLLSVREAFPPSKPFAGIKKDLKPAQLKANEKVEAQLAARVAPIVSQQQKAIKAVLESSQKTYRKAAWKLAQLQRAKAERNAPKNTFSHHIDESKLPAEITNRGGTVFKKLDWNNPPDHLVDAVMAKGAPELFNPMYGGFYVSTDPNSKHLLGMYIRGGKYPGKWHMPQKVAIKQRNEAKKKEVVERLEKKFPQILQTLKNEAPGNDAAAAMWLIAETGIRAGSKPKLDPERIGCTDLRKKHIRKVGGDLVIDFIGKSTGDNAKDDVRAAVRNYRTITKNAKYDLTAIEKLANSKNRKDNEEAWKRLVDIGRDGITYSPDLYKMMEEKMNLKGGPDTKLFDCEYRHLTQQSRNTAMTHGIEWVGQADREKDGDNNPSAHKYRNLKGYKLGDLGMKVYEKLWGTPKTLAEYKQMLGFSGANKVDKKASGSDRERAVIRHQQRQKAVTLGSGVVKGKIDYRRDGKPKVFFGVAGVVGHYFNDDAGAYAGSYMHDRSVAKAKKAIGAKWPGVKVPTSKELKKLALKPSERNLKQETVENIVSSKMAKESIRTSSRKSR